MAALATIEDYGNNAGTAVASGGYTSGSGVLNVDSTAAPFPQTRQFRVVIQDPTTKAVKVILKVTDLNSSTQWGVVAEGTDASAVEDDIVSCVLTAGAMDQIRVDIQGAGLRSALPSATYSKKGSRYKCTDSPFEYIHDGTSWLCFRFGKLVTVPVTADYTFIRNSSTTAQATDTPSGLFLEKGNQNGWGLYTNNTPLPTGNSAFDIEIGFDTCSVTSNGSYNAFSLCVLDANNPTSAKFEGYTIYWDNGDGRNGSTVVDKWDAVGFNNGQYSNDMRQGAPQGCVYMRYVNDTTNVTCYISRDGYNWNKHSVHSSTTFLTLSAPYWGIMMANENGSNQSFARQSYTWFHAKVS